MAPFALNRDSVSLRGLDFGGTGTPVLLLHGLAGHAGEWQATAEGLIARSRVVAPDGRGHGASERRPRDVSLSAHAADAAFVIEELGLGRVVVVGQSLGGQIAMLVASQRPDLVRGLVVAEADPGEGDARTLAEVDGWLGSWPVPFASRRQAMEFFGGSPESAAAWADGLELRDGGLWPRFEVDVMVRTLSESMERSYWSAWQDIQCPTLVIRAVNGDLPAATAAAMVKRLPLARQVELAGAGHDLHLDRPAEWRALLRAFLDSLDA